MTEAEWNVCADPTPMLEFLRGKASERKQRLFGCACCRRVGNLLTDKYSRKALAVAERYADGEVSAEKLGFAWGDARRAAQVVLRQERQTAEGTAMWAVAMMCEADIVSALGAVGLAARCKAYPFDSSSWTDAQRDQLFLLHDVFGNPFRRAAVAVSWLTCHDGAVRKLAHGIYDDRAFDHLPILADALEEAGCADQDILDHCRANGEHVRGCWVVDLLLGKS